jgi:hypothetical protein
VANDAMQSELRRDIDDLASSNPLQRLTAVRNIRALIEALEKVAVAQARYAGERRSWDEIARVMGTTRWTVLRRFGPRGTCPAEKMVLTPAGEAPAWVPALAEVPEESGDLPPELLEKAILLAGELAASSIQDGESVPDQPVGMRLQVFPRAIRIELWDAKTRSEAPVPRDAAAQTWIDVDLPKADLPQPAVAAEVLPAGAEMRSAG